MLKIVKCYNGTETIDGKEYKNYTWRLINGDEVICSCGCLEDSNNPVIEKMNKIKMTRYLAKIIKVEEITQQEDKELQIKNKISTAEKDIK